MNEESRTYLDFAASTPTHPEVREAMKPYWSDHFANPQSNHSHGRTARKAVSHARKKVADTLTVQPGEIVFTSGATEANSLAIKGALQASRNNRAHVCVSSASHPNLTSESTQPAIKSVPVDNFGRINQKRLQTQINPDTTLVSAPYANNEIGTIENLKAIKQTIRSAYQSEESHTLLHTDASQAGVYLPLQPHELDVDLMTINGHKLYGPKGVGILWVQSGTPLAPLFFSEKERVIGDYQTIRSGTPPVPLIVGLAEALAWAQNNHNKHKREVKAVREYARNELQELPHDLVFNGDPSNCIANSTSVSFDDTDHDYLATQLDTAGVSVSATSACQSDADGSAVLSAVPNTPEEALRISLGINTGRTNIDHLVNSLRSIITG